MKLSTRWKAVCFYPFSWNMFPVLGVLLLVLSGCASQAFDQAREENTVAAYDRFLAEYGDSEYASQAEQLKHQAREQSAFSLAVRMNHAEGYQQYLEQFPNSTNAAVVRSLMESLNQSQCPSWAQSGLVFNSENFVEGFAFLAYDQTSNPGLVQEQVFDLATQRVISNTRIMLSERTQLLEDLLREHLDGSQLKDVLSQVTKNLDFLLKTENLKLMRCHDRSNQEIYAIAIVNFRKLELEQLRRAAQLMQSHLDQKSSEQLQAYQQWMNQRKTELERLYQESLQEYQQKVSELATSQRTINP